MDLIQRAIRDSILRGEMQRTAGFAMRAEMPEDMPSDMPKKPKMPRFVLSTEGEATDRNIVRQFWDLSRAQASGIPIGYGHDFGDPDLYGTWGGLEIEEVEGRRRLVGVPEFDFEDPAAARLAGKIDRGILRSVSVGWLPGARVRRGELDPEDPYYREPEDDECGMPAEGYVMGTEDEPNQLVECSLTPIPADPAAVALERVARAGAGLGRLARGERISSRDVDLAGALLALRDAPGVRSFIRALVAEELAARASGAGTSTTNRFQRAKR